MNHKIQFYLFSAYLILQTFLLRYIYFAYGRSAYKTSAWILFPLLILVIVGIVIKNKWSLRDLGIRLDNIKANTRQLGVITLVFTVSLYLLSIAFDRPTAQLDQYQVHFLGLFLISSFGQEFLFRGFLIKLQQSIFESKTKIILINGLLFGLMHTMVISEPLYFTFIGTFLLGIAWVWAYLKNPNLIQVIASHAILNFLVAYLGFFSFKV